MQESNLQQQTRAILNANQFNCSRKIGKGGFGHVLLATKATSSSTYYAIKCLSKKKMNKEPQLKKSLLQEINTMAALEHPNIVKLFKTFEEGDWYFLVMEYCDMGNLYTMQSKLTNRIFTIDESISIFNQIVRGVEIMHLNKIVHRDIKLENIFVRKTDKNALVCKIGDFGLARFLEVNAHSNCGTQNYMAPEILEQVPYGLQVDIWSMGVLLFYIMVGDFPFKGINVLNDICLKCKGKFQLNEHKGKLVFRSKKEEANFVDLFAKIFQLNPKKRITITYLRDHPALKNKQVQDQSTTQQDASSQSGALVQWQINHMRFVQKIARQVETSNFLPQGLLSGFKFYINKVLLYMINKDSLRNFRKDRDGHPKLLKILGEMQADVGVKLQRLLGQLKENRQGWQGIPNFQDGLSTRYQDFTKFKMGYRNTIGRVYQQVHRKFSQTSRQRATLKLKVFLCHIINRVFVGSFNASIFPYFVTWSKREKGKAPRGYDFRAIQQWIQQESVDNLNSSQEIINKAFYK